MTPFPFIPFCLWYGVTCSRRHNQRITVLDLRSRKLGGSMSPHIGNLSLLRQLHLQNNSFTHDIPPEIGRLRRLQVLRVDFNSLSGTIPCNISNCINLINLSFGDNRLVGQVPSQLGSLSKLQIFFLQFNNLTGGIPPSLGNLSALEVFAAYDNKFGGRIPTSLGRWKKLRIFSLGLNNLSGIIPPTIYNISTLVFFSILQNQIEGSIPSDLGNTLPNLQNFNIGVNQFTGSIPLSLSNASSLLKIYVASNKLTGQVPSLRKLHNLVHFNVQLNHLGSGRDGDLSFVSDLSNSTDELEWLFLNSNNFGGTLPTSISNLSTKLVFLSVEENRLHGSIPTGIGNLVNLEWLSMGNNTFTRKIPTDIGKLSSLEKLSLYSNELSGSIPSSIGNLTKLTTLALERNNLQGEIPSSLRECHGLLQLNLSQNNLDGHIPQQLLNGFPSLSMSLDLSKNKFTGSLPAEVGSLKSVGKLDVSDNMLSGELPSSLGSCVSLEILHLQGNLFKGPIPSSMSSLRGLQDLDLSRNNFSGEIPPFLEGFRNLNNLNLSFNEFLGAVPIGGAFENASAISIIGNTKLCGGISDLRLPQCNSKESKKGGLSPTLKLIICLISASAVLGIAMVLTFLFLRWSRKKSKGGPLSTLANSALQVSYATLLKATDGFSSTNLIGAGGFGSVYKGVLLDEDRAELVAVKVFNMLRPEASKSFVAECEALRNIRHRNLVKVITVCSSVDFRGNDFKAVIYEFMDNGSLEEWLHPTIGKDEVRDAFKNLNLLQRLNIAIDVACAMDYLHNHCETPIAHCDLKPSNVLLDNEFTGHVSDFGLARFLSTLTSNDSANQSSSVGIRGSVGYAAPEYGMGSEVSTYGDVYSFGILLLEMFTGKRPTDNMFSDDMNLHNVVKMAFPERVTEVADSLLLQVGTEDTPNQCSVGAEKIEDCLSLIFRIGIACSSESPTDRMHSSDVASELQSIRDILLG